MVFCKECGKDKVNDGLDLCFECYNKLGSELMTITEKTLRKVCRDLRKSDENSRKDWDYGFLLGD